jgi:hypothetical protein
MKTPFSKAWLLLPLGLLLGGAAAAVFVPRLLHSSGPSHGADGRPAPSLPPDPRLAYSGPFLNVRPEVKYVGDKVCAGCHGDKDESFHHHPMGRSLSPVAGGPDLEFGERNHNPLNALGSSFRMELRGAELVQVETRADQAGHIIYQRELPVNYVLGSGSHGHSFLFDRGGYVVQMPISWYSSIKIWDISPGWRTVGAGRTVIPQCLFCHANQVEPMPGYINRYREPLFRGYSIGCERCHGPGEKHVAVRTGGDDLPAGPDYTIVNPKHLSPALREAVCQQCHLEGERRLVRRGREVFDFRPGLPLEDFWAIFVHSAHTEDRRAVNHVEQMYESACFRNSAGAGQMGCVSCHDPHEKVAEGKRVAWYRQKCLACHESIGCKVPEPERRRTSASDSCIDCHMPKSPTSDIVHTAGTDHRIPRRPNVTESLAAAPEGQLPLRLFHKKAGEKLTTEDGRELGIALAVQMHSGKAPRRFAPETLGLLEQALGQHPDDAEAWDAKGIVLQLQNRRPEALAAFKKALEQQPNFEAILYNAAMLAQAMDRLDEACDWWRRAVEMNPWQPEYHGKLALLLMLKNDLEGARKHGEEWLKLDPGHLDARMFWVQYWLKAGDKEKAVSAFATVEALNPPNLPELKAWFARQRR